MQPEHSRHINKIQPILSSSIGNILEWYDFGLFAIFSPLFAQIFFPEKDPHTALIATFGIFTIGFICRPLGAIIFGYLGDTQGRAKTLRISILMISLPTLLIGVLPSYQQVGILSPLLLMTIRIWQGISIGGEYSGNIIYLAECAPVRFRATITSFAGMGANIGILIASLIGILTTSIMNTHTLQVWGWRLPYLLSGILCLLIYAFRLRLPETSIFEIQKNKNQIVQNPLKTAITKNYLQILRTFGIVCMGSTFYYFCFIYIPLFLEQQHTFNTQHTSLIIALLISLMIFFVPLAGYLCDQIGRRKTLLITSLLIVVLVVPGFYLLHAKSFLLVILVLVLYTCISSLEQGVTSVTVVENFPLPARYTGLSLGYNLGNGLLGGTVPLVCEWLSQHAFELSPAVYIASCALITGVVVYFSVPETKGNNL